MRSCGRLVGALCLALAALAACGLKGEPEPPAPATVAWTDAAG